jgi:restriction endonuclease S subunit
VEGSLRFTRLTLKREIADPHFVATLFNALRIPLPSLKKQQSISQEVHRRREEVRQLREEAAKDWAAAKERFERRLLDG